MPIKPLTPWQRFVNLLTLEKKDILQISYYAIFSGIMTLSLPLGIQAIINLIQGAEISTSWIILVVLVTLGVAFSGILQLMQMRIIETIQQRIFTRSSLELSYRFPKIKMEELRNEYPPELANRFFDTLTIQKGLAKMLIDVPAALLQILFALILLSFYHPLFILFGIFLLTTIYFVFQYTAKKGLQASLVESKYKYKVVHWIQEVARSVTSFKLSGLTGLALRKNDALVEGYLKARESHFSVIQFQIMKMIGFKVLITAGLLIAGGVLVLQQKINIGQFVASEIIILLVIASVEKLILGLETLYDMLTSIEKIGQVVDKTLEPQGGEKPDFEQGMHIQFDHVFYGVPNRKRNILENVSLDIKPHTRLLIYGSSGSGRSSLLRLLAGVTTPTRGYLYVNQLSLSSLDLNYYRSHLGLSLSEEMPFESTLRENLTFGNPDIPDKKIYEVLDTVGLSGFLKKLPQGLSTLLRPEGQQIPYTISKRVVLARAILKAPKVFILEDEVDQYFQEKTHAIIDFLCQPSHPWALVVVSNNRKWEKHCDTIIRLKEGEVQVARHES